MAKGDYSTKFRPDLLRWLIQEGKTAQEIMEELSISPYTLKEHLLLLQRRDKKYYRIPGLFDDQKAGLRIIKRSRGRICLPGSSYLPFFRPADIFEMIERDGKTILRKIK